MKFERYLQNIKEPDKDKLKKEMSNQNLMQEVETTTKVIIFDGAGKDISDNVKLVNGKANPFGWSKADIEYEGKIIGNHYCGDINLNKPYTYKIKG